MLRFGFTHAHDVSRRQQTTNAPPTQRTNKADEFREVLEHVTDHLECGAAGSDDDWLFSFLVFCFLCLGLFRYVNARCVVWLWALARASSAKACTFT